MLALLGTPLTASAASNDFYIDGAPNGGGTLQAEINALDATHHVIQLRTNISITDGLVINGKNITFDLNGFNLSVSNNAGNGLDVRGGSVVDYINAGSFTASSSANNGYGLYVLNTGSSCTLTGAQATGTGGMAVWSTGQTTVVVNGDVTASSRGISVTAGTTVTVNGNVTVTGAGTGVAAANANTTVTVNGTITAETGINAATGSTVTVNSNVTATNTGVVAANANTTVTVNGTITAPTYIQLNGATKTAAAFVTPPPTPGYNTYADATPTTVLVKLPVTTTTAAVPTLGEWSLMLLALAMLGVAGAGLKRRG